MQNYLHPGVYIEEIPSGSRPIEGVATSITAFVGFANRGPFKNPTLIGSFDDYVNNFGRIVDEYDAMGLAVQAFYLNGGGSAYICRLAGDVATSSNETDILGEGAYAENANSRTATSEPVLTITASSPGTWGDKIRFKIEKNYRDSRLFSLLIGSFVDGAFEEEERFDNLSMDAKSDDYVATVINQNSSLIQVTVPDLTHQNAKISGADVDLQEIRTYLMDDTKSKSFMIGVNGSALKNVTLPSTFIDSSKRTEIATAMQDEIRATLGISEVKVIVNNSTFSIETTGTNNSSTSIQLIDSTLVTALGLSSDNVASMTGGLIDADATPSVVSNNNFQIVLDAFESVTVEFSDAISGGTEIATEIERQVQDALEDIPSYSGFSCSFNSASQYFTLTSGGSDVLESTILLTDGTGKPLVKLALATATATSNDGRTIQQGIDQVVPQTMEGTHPVAGFGERLQNGKNTTPIATDFTSFYNTSLRKYRDVSIVVLPGSSWSEDNGQSNIEVTLAHCESMGNRVLIIDPPKDIELKDAMAVKSLGLPTKKNCVLYYPWVSMTNPLYHPDKTPNKNKTVLVAPSAIAAGMWAKIDGKRGVWKAPAGVEAQLRGASSLKFNVENLEQDQLNPLGINCIRKLPNYGSVFWGARTLATKSDPEWRYVPVRRTAIYIEESIYQGIQWAVFELNNEPLWMSLRANIGSFMNSLFRAGAFQGKTAKDAYFVRCGLGDTMTQGDIDSGQVIVIVGFAPVKPAEFVIVRIQQKVGEE